MQRFALAALAALSLAGCASTPLPISKRDTAPPFEWKSPSGQSYLVSMNFDRKSEYRDNVRWESNMLTVFFNGKGVISGPLGRSYSGTLAGDLDGKPAVAACSATPKPGTNWIDQQCDIAVDGQKMRVGRESSEILEKIA